MSDRIRAAREARGWTQSELAARAGVSRQLLGAVEAGRQAPGVLAALALARALGTSVENLFGDSPAPAAEGVDLDGAPLAPGTPVRLARTARGYSAAPLRWQQADAGDLAAADATWDGERFASLPGGEPAKLAVAGCDPVLGIAAAGGLRRRVLAVHASSGRAAAALAAGRVHGAVVHGRADDLPVPTVPVRRWRLARWQVGLAARGARPRAEQLGGRSVVQRDPGAGAQQALLRALTVAGQPEVTGPVAHSHLGVARRLTYGVGDAGVLMEAAAAAYDLAFTPLEEHVVELWLAEDAVPLAAAQDLLHELTGRRVAARTALLAGYDAAVEALPA